MKEIEILGGVAYVDDEDYATLSRVKWSLHKMKNRNAVYAKNSDLGYMHRIVLDAGVGDVVDHVDGNGLNCQKENLRLCTRNQNEWNKGKYKSNTSGFKGVSWHKQRCMWRASIYVFGKQKHLGLYTTQEAAYDAYCKAADLYHGEFANKGIRDP